MSVSEIQKMTPAERIHTMELLWDALLHEPADIEPPAWHGSIVAERMELMNAPEAEFYTLDQLKERFRR